MSVRICAIASLFAFLGAVFSTSVISFWPYELGLLPQVAATRVEQWDIMSFGGVLVTLMSLVSAFYILLLAIDAFALSKTITSNEDRIDNNDAAIADLSDRSTKLDGLMKDLDSRASVFSEELVLVETFLNEMNSENNESERVFTILEVVVSKLEDGKPLERLILDGRSKFRQRRARVNALVALFGNELSEAESESLNASIPELLKMAQLGDVRSSKILASLKKVNKLVLEDFNLEELGLDPNNFTVSQ